MHSERRQPSTKGKAKKDKWNARFTTSSASGGGSALASCCSPSCLCLLLVLDVSSGSAMDEMGVDVVVKGRVNVDA
jgi:hypothetical protein